MAKSTTRIQTKTAFPQYRRALHAAVKAGVETGSEYGAAAARATAPRGDGRSGNRPGHMADTIEPVRLQARRRGGYRGGFGSSDPNVLWHAHGTLGRRSKKLHTGLDGGRAEETRRALRETKAGKAYGLKPNPWMRRALIGTALPVAVSTMKARAGTRLL